MLLSCSRGRTGNEAELRAAPAAAPPLGRPAHLAVIIGFAAFFCLFLLYWRLNGPTLFPQS